MPDRLSTPTRARRCRGTARLAALAAAAAVTLALIPPAALGSGSPVLADCNLHLHLTRSYSIAQLQHALQVMPADISQYTDCATVIRQALDSQLAAARGAQGAGGDPSGGAGVPVWLIAILAVVVAGGGAASLVAWRRQRAG
jgi:hypothetical protein